MVNLIKAMEKKLLIIYKNLWKNYVSHVIQTPPRIFHLEIYLKKVTMDGMKQNIFFLQFEMKWKHRDNFINV